MNVSFDDFLPLAETLAAEGWDITEFKNLGGGMALTLVPGLPLAETVAKAGWEIAEFKNSGEGATLTVIPKGRKATEAEA
jgi:hypothetical protein